MIKQLLEVRSQLVSEVLAYLNALAARMAELPSYYPAHLHTGETGKTRFDDIRQMVQVVEDRSAFERWLAEERERMRAAGQDVGRVAYDPTRARPEAEERHEMRSHRPMPPPPVLWDERAGERFRRAVILGDPGFGKTWLLRYEARRLALEGAQLLHAHSIGLPQLTLPVFARLSDLNQSDDSVEEALVALTSAGRSEAFRRYVREKLQSNRCVILLDAWDEVPVEIPTGGQPVAYLPRHRQRLGQRLEAFARQFPQPRVLLTSRIVGYTASPIPDAQELELLAFEMPQTESFVHAWFGNDTDTANQFLAILRRSAQVRGLARIPLMLALMCRAYQEKQLAFPTRRVELYDRCLRGLLRDWRMDDKWHEGLEVSDAYVEAILELLQAVSYTLFAEGYEQFSESVLRTAIVTWLNGLPSNHELCESKPASLITELKGYGVLITAGEHRDAPLLFAHRTFHEYLTAREMGRIVNDPKKGWQAEIELQGKKVTVRQLVDRKAWDPRWQEVIVLFTAQLRDPMPLLQLLTDEKRDDMFRHRLGLAALCLPEIPLVRRTQLTRLVDGITTTAFSLWWRHKKMNTTPAIPALTRALPALGQVNGRVNGTPLLERISQHLGSEEWEELYAAIMAGSEIGNVAATPVILDRLAQMLLDPDRHVQWSAVEAVGGIGSAAATPYFLDQLAQMLRDPDVRSAAAEAAAVEGIGSAAATPDFLDQLTQMLRDPDPDVQWAAALAVGGIGNVAATPVILDRLAQMLLDPDVRWAAAEAVRGIGSAAATPYFLNQLTQMLRDPDRHVQWSAVDAIGTSMRLEIRFFITSKGIMYKRISELADIQ